MKVQISVIIGTMFLLGCGGKGGGNNQPASTGIPTLPISTLIADVNGDGKNDLIVSNGQSSDGFIAPLVFINGGNGSSFTYKSGAIPGQYAGASSSAVDIQSGDFNKDGRLDLVTIAVHQSYQSAQIQLYLGKGDGTFSDASANIATSSWPPSLACNAAPMLNGWPAYLRVVDVDGDGNLDIVASGAGANTCGGVIYRNDGAGKFAPANISITDGVTTVVATSMRDATNFWATEVLSGDLNNDGKIDFFAPSPVVGTSMVLPGGVQTSGGHVAFLNTSTPGVVSFTAIHSVTPSAMLHGALLDINGDGFLDVVGSLAYSYPSYTTAMPVVALLGNGLGSFTENNALLSPQPSVIMARQFIAVDVNADAKKDLFIVNCGPDVAPFPGERSWLMVNNGAGKLADMTSTNFTMQSAYTHQAAFGDLNGDGTPDLIMNNSYQSLMSAPKSPRFWLNNGSGVFASYTPTFN